MTNTEQTRQSAIQLVSHSFFIENGFTESEGGFYKLAVKTDDVYMLCNAHGYVWIDYVQPSEHKESPFSGANQSIGVGKYDETKLKQLIWLLQNCG